MPTRVVILGGEMKQSGFAIMKSEVDMTQFDILAVKFKNAYDDVINSYNWCDGDIMVKVRIEAISDKEKEEKK